MRYYLKKGGQRVKLYSRRRLAYAIFAFFNALMRIRSVMKGGGAWDAVMIVLWGIAGLIAMCFAFDREYGEQEQRQEKWNRLASRQLFGRGCFLVENFGVGLILASMFGLLVDVDRGIPLALILAGVVYTVVVCAAIGRRARRMEAEGKTP